MKTKIVGIVMAGALVLAAAAPSAMADMLQDYQNFLAGHPLAASALQTDPSLYNSPGFMAQHPNISAYLQQHPGVYSSVSSSAPPYRPDANALALSQFLHQHQGVSQAINENPLRTTDPTFLAQHPNFRQFLKTHPTVQQRLATRGWNFKQWQQYHPYDKQTQWSSVDDWSDRDWRGYEQWQNHGKAPKKHGHHDNGKHLGWYKHDGKGHHHDYDDYADNDDHDGHHHAHHHDSDHHKHKGHHNHHDDD